MSTGEIKLPTNKTDAEAMLREMATPVDGKSTATHARATASVQLHHENPGENALGVSRAFSAFLVSNEQAYDRRYAPPTAPAPADTGWVADPSIVYMQNNHGMVRQVIPTEAELAAHEECVVYYAAADPDGPPPTAKTAFILRPGRPAFVEVNPGTRLWIWAAKPGTRIQLFAIPR